MIGTVVKKAPLLCSVNESGQVEYVSFSWTGSTWKKYSDCSDSSHNYHFSTTLSVSISVYGSVPCFLLRSWFCICFQSSLSLCLLSPMPGLFGKKSLVRPRCIFKVAFRIVSNTFDYALDTRTNKTVSPNLQQNKSYTHASDWWYFLVVNRFFSFR